MLKPLISQSKKIMLAYLQGRDLFIQDCYAGADSNYRICVRVITETAWHSLFARNLFIGPNQDELASFIPDFTEKRADEPLALDMGMKRTWRF
ncbi:MAG: phosphoenolpyruvate carboxykinase (ATP) [Phormidium sp.]